MTGYTATSSELYHRTDTGTRPKQVPPLRLGNTSNRPYRSSQQRFRASRIRHQMSPSAEELAAGTT